jgi:TonB-linked SusC/RagA family outer membrane protein
MKKNVVQGPLNRYLTKLLLVMKLCSLLLLISVTSVTASSVYSQNTRLSLNLRNATIRQVINEIEKQSEFIFVFYDGAVDLDKHVTIKVSDQRVDQILEKVFESTGNTYSIFDRQIVIGKKETRPEETVKPLTEEVQQEAKKELRGKVTDAKGEPIPGAAVMVKGTTIGTVTNFEGVFNLSVPVDAKILVFSFVGYKILEVAIDNKSVYNVSMEEMTVGLEEVVAVGYGTQKKINITGSVSVARAERIENRPVSSVGQALQGVIPNLNITFANGDPATAAKFNIRGFESINGGEPLILVDGVPMSLDRINPNDIESVNVLKDASASSIYGSRGAFGVILVETKKASEGKFNVDFRYESSLAKPIFHVDPVNDPYQYALITNQIDIVNTGVATYDDRMLENFKRYSENPTLKNTWGVYGTNLEFYGTNNFQNFLVADFTPQHKYDINLSGNTQKTSFFVSFGYLDKPGFFRDNDCNLKYKRYNVLLKGDIEALNWLHLDSKVTVNVDKNDEPHDYGQDYNLNSIISISPMTPVTFPDLPYYLEEGDREQYEPYIGSFLGARMYPYLKSGGRTTYDRYDVWLTQGATIMPFKNFKIRSDFSYRFNHLIDQDAVLNVEILHTDLSNLYYTPGDQSVSDYIESSSTRNLYYVFNTYGEYFVAYKKHELKAMVGFNQEWGSNMKVAARGYTLVSNSILDIGATTGTRTVDGSRSHLALRGAFSRLNYTYNNKYLFEFSGRYDGSSRFPKKSRMAFFPSGSVGWRISDEPFMHSAKSWLDNLMLRVSYGSIGNQLLGNNYYAYINSMAVGQGYAIMGGSNISYITPADLVSSKLTWETVTTQNVGLDIMAFSQRLNISADAYFRDTKNMLMKKSYPEILGADAPFTNSADMRTRGWELSVNWSDKIGKDLKYGIILSLSDNSTEITKYENPTGAFDDYYVGKKVGEIWGFETKGIFQNTEEITAAADQSQISATWLPGDIQYVDQNNDSKITKGSLTLSDPGDLKRIGNTSARYPFGISTNLNYKNWSLNIFFQGVCSRDYFPERQTRRAFWPGFSDSIEKWWIDECWSESNRDAFWPAIRDFRATDSARNFEPQTHFLQNAGYIRLKDVRLTYNLPKKITNKMTWLKEAKITIGGMNLWEYTKIHKPLDPESVSTRQQYYFQRIYSVGLNIGL